MRAIVLEKFGGLDSLVYKDIPEPEPKLSFSWQRPFFSCVVIARKGQGNQ